MNTELVQPMPAKLPVPALLLRLAAIGAILGVIAGLFAYAGGWFTPHKLTPAAFADRFQQINGIHSGFRRNHAKGVGVSGWFTSNGNGIAVCKAAIFQPGKVPVIGRFSLAGGQPYAADADAVARGLGLRFAPPGGEEWRTAMLNLPVFPVATPKAFYDQLLAMAPDKATGQPDPAKVKAFLAGYPESAKALALIKSQPKPSGFANSAYNSLNTFRITNAAGETAWVRWSLAPVEPFIPVAPAGAGSQDKNRLFDALIADVHAHPLEWHLILTIAGPGDPLDDATLPWPPGRRSIDAGTLTIDHIESEETSPARDLNFDPLILPDGIAPSNDPLLSARSAVYSQSFTRREGESREPSAVTAAETGKQP